VVSLEVLIPVRNPGEVFAGTVDSLLAQRDRNFSVLLSDNYSTEGLERIEAATERMAAGGIAVRRVRPPYELGRVQHWNWLHHQSSADWLKPLFVGDRLRPECLEACRALMASEPQVQFIFFQFELHRGKTTTVADLGGLSGFVDPAEAFRKAIFEGNFGGGPVNVLYTRTAFQAAGGHLTSLPLMADFDLYTRLATQVPSYALARVLGDFVLHDQRFAKRGSGTRRESMNAEWVLAASLFAYAAAGAGHPIPSRQLFPRLLHLLVAWGRETLLRALGRWRHRR
jgi:glycosyltransferase involved in cell wall biosynthesis